jgi:hypothetical protein
VALALLQLLKRTHQFLLGFGLLLFGLFLLLFKEGNLVFVQSFVLIVGGCYFRELLLNLLEHILEFLHLGVLVVALFSKLVDLVGELLLDLLELILLS